MVVDRHAGDAPVMHRRDDASVFPAYLGGGVFRRGTGRTAWGSRFRIAKRVAERVAVAEQHPPDAQVMHQNAANRRPVTPEVAGSSPVAPALYYAVCATRPGRTRHAHPALIQRGPSGPLRFAVAERVAREAGA
jgi:hypothetical protein